VTNKKERREEEEDDEDYYLYIGWKKLKLIRRTNAKLHHSTIDLLLIMKMSPEPPQQ